MKLTALAIALAALSGTAGAAVGDRIAIAGGGFTAGRDPIWINGANTPWHSWNDFGGDFNYAWWDSEFRTLRENGINATRVWVTCDGEVGILIDGRGHVSGATRAHWENLDSLFQIAARHRVYVMATLMSFDHLQDSHPNYRNWRRWLGSDANLDSYVDNYLLPFVRRYGGSPYLWSIDLMNEPDWVYENREDGRLPWDRLQGYFARAARAIHRNSPLLVTVGMAMPKYLSETAVGARGNKVSDRALQARIRDPEARLDFYCVHYYDWCGETWGNALHMTPAAYKLPVDKPGIVGEMPAKGTRDHTTEQDYEGAYRNGWAGVMGWSADGVDAMGDIAQLGPATRAFRARHPGLVFP